MGSRTRTYHRTYYRKTRPRRKAIAFRSRFKIELAAAEKFRQKSGLCPICQTRRSTDWDHDHMTGIGRGWLCHQCNLGLGGFKDNPVWMRRAIRYLADHRRAVRCKIR